MMVKELENERLSPKEDFFFHLMISLIVDNIFVESLKFYTHSHTQVGTFYS